MHQQLSAQINQVLLEVPALIRCTPAQGTCSAGMGETAKNSGKRKGIFGNLKKNFLESKAWSWILKGRKHRRKSICNKKGKLKQMQQMSF